MAEIITHRYFEYRSMGREIHRRPAEREGLCPADAAWLVMNQDHHYVPPVVREQFEQPREGLRFD